MDTRLLKLLKEQINKIENLKTAEQWGPEYKIWKNTTTKIVEDLFGKDYLELFKHSDTSVFSYIDDGFNQKQYLEELDKKKKLLEGFIQEKTRLEVESFVSIGKTLGLMDYDLHSLIKEVSQRRFEDGHYADAVEAAFKEVIKRVKEYIKDKTGENLDGDKAMNRAFGFEKQDPLIKFNKLQTDEEKDEQKGIMFLFKGIVGIRNRKAHENVILDDPCKAIEYLALASLLMRLFDEYAK
jgi:uncharacterized protein (TIGR02391 family)